MEDRVERLQNGFVRVDFRGSGLVGLYEVDYPHGITARSGSSKWLSPETGTRVILAASPHHSVNQTPRVTS